MSSDEPIAYVDGEFVPRSEATVSITDPGLTWGYNVYDVFRTVDHEPYQLEEHLDRLFRSCRAARIDAGVTEAELREIATEIVDANAALLDPADDLWVTINVSGDWSVYPDEEDDDSATVVVYSDAIPFARNARKFLEGATLVTPGTRQYPRQSLSPEIKHRSRMHFVLADREAKRVDPTADPLLLDAEGYVTEVKHANVFVASDGTLRTPPTTRALPGVSRATTLEIAREDPDLDVAVEDLQLYDVYNADEVFYTNTTHFLAPVTEVDGVEIGDGTPGPVARRLLDRHGERAGIDVVEQFLTHLDPADRPETLELGGGRR